MFDWSMTRITSMLHEDLCTFLVISRWILIRIRNVSEKKVVEKIKHTFMLNIFVFQNLAVYQIMRKNMARSPQTKIWRMRFACLLTKAADTHSEYVVLIAFARHQPYGESNSLLRYSTLPVLLSISTRFRFELCVQWRLHALNSGTNGNEICPKLNLIQIGPAVLNTKYSNNG
jgi:hypothetical protein